MGAATEQEEPMFRDVYEALKFAFNFSHGQVKKPLIAYFSGGSRRSRGLVGQDGAAQAGLILAEVSKLPEKHSQYILAARFAKQFVECNCCVVCCSGQKPNQVWVDAISEVTDYVVCALSGISNYRLRRSLVERYFGAKATFSVIAERNRVNRATASIQNEKIAPLLGKEERRAMLHIADAFHGLKLTA